jgi:hypothetical protein
MVAIMAVVLLPAPVLIALGQLWLGRIFVVTGALMLAETLAVHALSDWLSQEGVLSGLMREDAHQQPRTSVRPPLLPGSGSSRVDWGGPIPVDVAATCIA